MGQKRQPGRGCRLLLPPNLPAAFQQLKGSVSEDPNCSTSSLPQRAAGGAGGGAQGSGRLFRVRPRLAAVRSVVTCTLPSGSGLLPTGCGAITAVQPPAAGPAVPCAGLHFQSARCSHLQASALPLLFCRSVHTFAEAFKALGVPLHVLALNAGTFLWPYRK